MIDHLLITLLVSAVVVSQGYQGSETRKRDSLTW